MRQLLWIIVPGITVILVACAYNSGPGTVTMSIYRELGIDSNISAAVTPASAPSSPLKGK
jgi:hypothetical protein